MNEHRNSLRVLYSFSDRLGLSGIGMIAWHQVTGLLNEGVRISVYCPSCERPLPKEVTVVETMKLGAVRLPLRRVGPVRPRAIHDRKVAGAVRRLAGEIDLIHCWPGTSVETLRAAKCVGVLSLLERPNSHTRVAFETVSREYARLGMPPPKLHSHTFDAQRLAIEETEYELCDRLLCPSDFVADSFKSAGFCESKIARHQYGYDAAQFTQPKEQRADDGAGGLSLAFIGSCEPRKGLHYALDAWLSSGAAETGTFHICGRFVPGYREVLGERLLHRSVIEQGFVQDPSSILRSCDALVLPSIEEGSALVTYEARACGCVLLVSDATGARCSHMQDGMVHRARDAVGLREQITLLASDRSLLHTLRAASMRTLNEITWDHAGHSLANAYRQCLGDRR